MTNPFQQAKKSDSYLKLLITGASGSGKTYSALSIAKGLGFGKPAVVDSEHGSASKYADVFDFDVVNLEAFSPATYIAMIDHAVQAGYKIIVIDSMTHCWKWCLDESTRITERSGSKNSFASWSKVTPMWDGLLTKIVQSPIHIIATGRSKEDYEIVEDEKGRKTPKKAGTKPILRDECSYEFDIVMDMNQEHKGIITKTRCSALTDAVIDRPNGQVSSTLLKWLTATPDQVRKSAPAPAATTPSQPSAPAAPSVPATPTIEQRRAEALAFAQRKGRTDITEAVLAACTTEQEIRALFTPKPAAPPAVTDFPGPAKQEPKPEPKPELYMDFTTPIGTGKSIGDPYANMGGAA